MNAAVATSPPACDRCNDTRRVWNQLLRKKIRCPQCTTRSIKRDPYTMDRVSNALSRPELKLFVAKEGVRVGERIDALLTDAIVNAYRFKGLSDHLVTTDRVLQRWAAAPTGNIAANPDVYHITRPPPLDPRTQEAVSDVLRATPKGIGLFVADWYLCGSWLSQDQMARDRHMTRRQLNDEWFEVLTALRTAFLKSSHNDLVKLVRQMP